VKPPSAFAPGGLYSRILSKGMKETKSALSENQEWLVNLLDEIEASLETADLSEFVLFDRRLQEASDKLTNDELSEPLTRGLADMGAKLDEATSRRFGVNLREVSDRLSLKAIQKLLNPAPGYVEARAKQETPEYREQKIIEQAIKAKNDARTRIAAQERKAENEKAEREAERVRTTGEVKPKPTASELFNTAHGIKSPRPKMEPYQAPPAKVEGDHIDNKASALFETRIESWGPGTIEDEIFGTYEELVMMERDLVAGTPEFEHVGKLIDILKSQWAIILNKYIGDFVRNVAAWRHRRRKDVEPPAAREPNEVIPPPPPLPTATPPAPEEPVVEIKAEEAPEYPLDTEIRIEGMSLKELTEIGFYELSPGQQKLALENLDQLMLGKVYEESGRAYQEKNKQANLMGAIWRGISQHYQISKEKKSAAKAILSDVGSKKQLLVELVRGLINYGPEVSDDGRNISYLSSNILEQRGVFDTLSNEQFRTLKNKIDRFNVVAGSYAKIPYEHGTWTGGHKERKTFAKAKDTYDTARIELLVSLPKDFALTEVFTSQLAEAERNVTMTQWLHVHPEASSQLAEIADRNVWRRAFGAMLTERGLQTALGGIARSTAVTLAGAMALPFAAAGTGALFAGLRVRAAQRERTKMARRGARDRSFSAESVFPILGNNEYGKHSIGLVGKLRRDIDNLDTDTDKVRAIDRLSARLQYTEAKMKEGALDFGTGAARIVAGYELLRVLSEAKSLLNTQSVVPVGGISAKIEKWIKSSAGKRKNNRRDEIIMRGIGGAIVGSAFAYLGAELRALGEHFGWWGHQGTGTEIAREHIAPSPKTPAIKLFPSTTDHAITATPPHEQIPPPVIPEVPVSNEAASVIPRTPINAIQEHLPSEQYTKTIEKGGSLWRAAQALGRKCNIGDKEFRAAWSNPKSQVFMPDGSVKHISKVDLTHAGDEVQYVPAVAGEKNGHFEFHQGSGLRHGLKVGDHLPNTEHVTETPAPKIAPTPIESHTLSTPTEHLPGARGPLEWEKGGAYPELPTPERHMQMLSPYKDILKVKNLNLTERQYIPIRNLNIMKLLKELPEDEKKAWRLFETHKIKLPHSGRLYTRAEFMEQFKFAKVLRRLMRKEGLSLNAVNKISIAEFLRQLGKKNIRV